MHRSRIGTPLLILATGAVVLSCGPSNGPVGLNSDEVAAIAVTPSVQSIQVGSTAQFNATATNAAGEVVDADVTWSSSSPTVATVSSDGVATALAEGDATISASASGVTEDATLGVLPEPVSEVTVSPAQATIEDGQTIQFSAQVISEGGSEMTDAPVTWSSSATSVATIDENGLATGVGGGTVEISASADGVTGTSDLTVQAQQTAPGRIADLASLPVAAGQGRDGAAYDALNVPGMPSGGQYNDPLTGVLVTKITDSSTPLSNSDMAHPYSNGPLQISHRWGANDDMYTLVTYHPNDGSVWLVDYQLGGTLSNWRAAPAAGDLKFTFSKNSATPRIAYYLAGGTLRRYNTATDSEESTGHFPISGQGSGWLQNDANDEWFISTGSGNVYAANAATGETRQRDGGSGFDEAYLEHGGRYVIFIRNAGSYPGPWTNTIWDLETNTASEVGSNPRVFHAASLFDYFTATDVDNIHPTEWYRVRASDGAQTEIYNPGGNTGEYHDAGQWLQPDVPRTEQYFLKSEWKNCGDHDVPCQIAFVRLDGADVRTLNHHYSQSSKYYSQPHGTLSPDGLLVMWSSDMRGSGRGDVFVAEVPRR